ncbi:MAG TPA: hypothetical protein VME45_05150 [Stellaceae bacterium]|nr:hypothetical protein [Stellaceae bacterium]
MRDLVREAVFPDAVSKADQLVDIAHQLERALEAGGVAVNVRDDAEFQKLRPRWRNPGDPASSAALVNAEFAYDKSRAGSFADLARRIWNGVAETGEATLDDNATIRLASTWAIKQARAVVDELYHAAGATAIVDARPCERRSAASIRSPSECKARSGIATAGGILLGLESESTMLTPEGMLAVRRVERPSTPEPRAQPHFGQSRK